jgi:RimJ/RimL family protein N-acetyltransferase
MTIVHTARLALRPLSESDRGAVVALGAAPRVMEALGGPLSVAQSEAWLARQLRHFSEHGYGRYALLRNGQFVGVVGLSRTDFDRGIVSGVEVTWRLGFEHWGHGYASEAARAVIDEGFERLGLSEVIAVTTVSNLRSRRVMDRLGMRQAPDETFDHPLFSEDDPLRRHVVYRLRRRCA